MKLKTNLVALGVVVALGAGQQVVAGQKKEQDSVYQWGRWAVLSPAAGGPPPYVAALEPDAVNNARPEEAEEFSPKVLGLVEPEPPIPPEPPVVVESCTAGAQCSFATYSRQEGDGPTNGPVLASFDTTTREVPPVDDPTQDPGTFTAFSVTDSGDSVVFPDVSSAEMKGEFQDGDLSGDERISTVFLPADEVGGPYVEVVVQTSELNHSNPDTGDVISSDGVTAGYWQDEANRIVRDITGVLPDENTPLYASNGYFVFGQTPTVEQMESFAAGRVNATYSGSLIDYGSAVTLNFDFGRNSWNGSFASENGFNGFTIANGGVNGVNFSAAEAGNVVNGSFFNEGFNAAGSASNGSQVGVFSTTLEP